MRRRPYGSRVQRPGAELIGPRRRPGRGDKPRGAPVCGLITTLLRDLKMLAAALCLAPRYRRDAGRPSLGLRRAICHRCLASARAACGHTRCVTDHARRWLWPPLQRPQSIPMLRPLAASDATARSTTDDTRQRPAWLRPQDPDTGSGPRTPAPVTRARAHRTPHTWVARQPAGDPAGSPGKLHALVPHTPATPVLTGQRLRIPGGQTQPLRVAQHHQPDDTAASGYTACGAGKPGADKTASTAATTTSSGARSDGARSARVSTPPPGNPPIKDDPGPVDQQLLAIIQEVCDEPAANMLEAEAMPDHVHLLLSWIHGSGSPGSCLYSRADLSGSCAPNTRVSSTASRPTGETATSWQPSVAHSVADQAVPREPVTV